MERPSGGRGRRGNGPAAAVAFSGAVSLLLLLALGAITWGTYRVHSEEQEFARLEGTLDRLDALDGRMSRAAGLRLLSGDSAWEARYAELAGKLEAGLRSVVEQAGEAGQRETAERLRAAEARMTALERESIALARRGDPQGALSLLSGPDYLELKEEAATAIREMEDSAFGLRRRYGASVRRFVLVGGMAAAAVLLALAVLWLWVLRLLRRYVEERDQAEQALVRSEREVSAQRAYLRAAIDASPSLILAMDREGRFTLANRAIAQLYGTTPEGLVGKRPVDLGPEVPEMEDYLRENRRVIDTGEALVVPEMPRTDARTGEVRWYQTVKVRLDPPDGGPPQVLAVATDITARKRAKAELAAAEAHYRRLVETSPEAIYVLDAEGRVAELNPAGERLIDRLPEEVMGHHFSDFVAPEDLPRAEELLSRLMSGRENRASLELRLVRPSGERRLIAVSAAAIVDGGKATGVHGIIKDVTEERTAQERRTLLTTILDRLGQGVAVTDSRGIVAYANPATFRLLGFDPERLPELTLADFLPDGEAGEEAREEAEAIMEALRRDGQWSGRVWRRRLSDGRMIPLDCVAGKVESAEGAEEYVLAIFHDASRAVEMERHLRRAERLTSLGTLVRGVAHELNNPLHAIRNFADLMLLEPRGEDDREALGFIRNEADRATEVVADMHGFAREAEEESERSVVDLNDAVREAIRLHQYSLRPDKLTIVQELADDLPPILASRHEVEQVVLRLLSNAEDALEEWRGERRLRVRTRPSALGAAVEILDTGPGISAEHLEQIFDPFWTTNAPGEGTGLGLSVVHSIVANHGGYIRVESEPGKGTAFVVDFPRAHLGDAPD